MRGIELQLLLRWVVYGSFTAAWCFLAFGFFMGLKKGKLPSGTYAGIHMECRSETPGGYWFAVCEWVFFLAIGLMVVVLGPVSILTAT